jgi:hypothetical protein
MDVMTQDAVPQPAPVDVGESAKAPIVDTLNSAREL